MTTCGIFGETGTDSEIDKWLERMKEDKEMDDQLMAKMDIPEQERLRYYKAGLADAIELIHYLRT